MMTPNKTDYSGTNLKFSKALAVILAEEGGFVDDKADSGGATNMGITQHTYDAWHTEHGWKTQSVNWLTRLEASSIYRDRYWDPLHLEILDYGVALIIFDTAVQWGIHGAESMLTLLCPSEVGKPGYLPERVRKENPEDMIDRIAAWRSNFRIARVKKNPTQIRFLLGWKNRDNKIKALALDGFKAS